MYSDAESSNSADSPASACTPTYHAPPRRLSGESPLPNGTRTAPSDRLYSSPEKSPRVASQSTAQKPLHSPLSMAMSAGTGQRFHLT